MGVTTYAYCECNQQVCRKRVSAGTYRKLFHMGNVVALTCRALPRYEILATLEDATVVKCDREGLCVERVEYTGKRHV